MDRSTPGLPVHRQLLELAQTHVHESVMPKQVCFYRRPGPTFPIFGDKGVLLPPGAGVHFHMSDLFLALRDRKESQSVLALGPFLYFFCAVSLLCMGFL